MGDREQAREAALDEAVDVLVLHRQDDQGLDPRGFYRACACGWHSGYITAVGAERALREHQLGALLASGTVVLKDDLEPYGWVDAFGNHIAQEEDLTRDEVFYNEWVPVFRLRGL